MRWTDVRWLNILAMVFMAIALVRTALGVDPWPWLAAAAMCIYMGRTGEE